MKRPLFVRPLTDDERAQLEAARRSPDAFTLRRAQILLASARGESAQAIALALGCCSQSVRNAIRAFNAQGLDSLRKQSNRPKSVCALFDAGRCERLGHLLHQSPRTFGKSTGRWSLALLAQVCQEQGITEQVVSDETIRRALHRMQVSWKRAKHWISSPDPAYGRKKGGVTG